jgi:hypothetical protein
MSESARRFLSRIVAASLALWLSGPALAADSKDGKSQDEELIRLQIFSDMMEGADDYFGENSDLSYADHVIPTSRLPPPPPPPPVAEEKHDDEPEPVEPPPEPPPEEPPPPP